jgi:hypothetical protein
MGCIGDRHQGHVMRGQPSFKPNQSAG